MTSTLDDHQRIVLTGIGLTTPNGNTLPEFRDALLNGRSGVQKYDIRYVGETLAGICNFDELKYQKKKEVRRGTRAGSISIYCAQEAVADSGFDWANIDRERVGVYIGVTEHGNVETENEIYEIKGYDYDTSVWSHHHNPRTVANNPAGEITLNMGITGPHYTIGAACAAGNAGMIQGAQMLRLRGRGGALPGCGWASAMWRWPVASRRVFAHLESLPALPARARSPSTKILRRPRDRSIWIAT